MVVYHGFHKNIKHSIR